jgi:putative selenium metabolism protein SsnA
MSLVVRGATVVTSLVDPVVVEQDIVVDGGRVVDTPAVGGLAAARVDAVVDATGCLVLPGLVCAHTHAYSALARGMPYHLAAPRTFVEILRRVWWRLDRALDLPSIRASARVAGLEALMAGTTTLVDHHASPNAIDGSLDVIGDAVEELGLRSILAYEVTDRDGPERAAAGIRENDRYLGRVAGGSMPLRRGLVGAHASFTLSDPTLEATADVARRHGVGVHIHVAEGIVDERDALARHGRRVAERLERAGALSDRAVLAHAVHLDDAEIACLRGSGATVVTNARSNLNNGVGRSPVEWLGPRIALGTDGIGGDLFEESRVAWLVQRAAGVAIDDTWSLRALAIGALAVGRAFGEPALGRIEPGAPADLIVLDQRPPTPLTAETWPGHWRFGLSAAGVRDVIVGGRLVVRDRRPTLVDLDEVMADARREAVALWARIEAIDEHPFDPEPDR